MLSVGGAGGGGGGWRKRNSGSKFARADTDQCAGPLRDSEVAQGLNLRRINIVSILKFNTTSFKLAIINLMGIMVIYPTWQLCNNDGQQFKDPTEKKKKYFPFTLAPRKFTKENLYKSPGKESILSPLFTARGIFCIARDLHAAA